MPPTHVRFSPGGVWGHGTTFKVKSWELMICAAKRVARVQDLPVYIFNTGGVMITDSNWETVGDGHLLFASLSAHFQKRAVLSVDEILEPVVVSSASGDIVQVNSVFLQTFGYSLSEIVGQNVRVLIPDSDPNRVKHDEYIARFDSGMPATIIGTHGRKVVAKHKLGGDININLSIICHGSGFAAILYGIGDEVRREQLEAEKGRVEQERAMLAARADDDTLIEHFARLLSEFEKEMSEENRMLPAWKELHSLFLADMPAGFDAETESACSMRSERIRESIAAANLRLPPHMRRGSDTFSPRE